MTRRKEQSLRSRTGRMPRGRWMQLQFSYFRLRIQILRDYKTVVMLPQYVCIQSRQSIEKVSPMRWDGLGSAFDALVLSTCVRSSSQFGGWEVKITPIICKCVRAFSFFTITTIEPMANCRCLCFKLPLLPRGVPTATSTVSGGVGALFSTFHLPCFII